jgi:hypothetical protein
LLHQILIRLSRCRGWEGQCTYYAWKRWEINTKFCSENMKTRDELEDLGIDGRVIVEWILGKFKNTWSYTSTPPTYLHGMVLSKAQRQLYLYLTLRKQGGKLWIGFI